MIYKHSLGTSGEQTSRCPALLEQRNTYANTNYLYYTYKQADLNKAYMNTIYQNYSSPIINDTMSKIENYKICLHNSESEKEKDDDNSGFSILFG